MTDPKERYTRRELYNAVWKEPVEDVAKRFGLSGRGLGKLCERNSIPVPPRGYWQVKAAGKRVVRPPLLDLEGSRFSDEVVAVLSPRALPQPVEGPPGATPPNPFLQLWEELVGQAKPVRVPGRLTDPHRIVAGWLADEERNRRLYPTVWPGTAARQVSKLEGRRRRLLSALLKQLEASGCSVSLDEYRSSNFKVSFQGDKVGFTVHERIRQYRRQLTEEERAKSWGGKQKWSQEREATGELVLKLTTYQAPGVPDSWQDKPDLPLESQLHLAIAGLFVAIAREKQLREEREAEERRRWEAHEEALRREQERKAEEARQAQLLAHARAWRDAALVRDYVAEVRAAARTGELAVADEQLTAWAGWALQYAQALDPIQSKRAVRAQDQTANPGENDEESLA